MEASETEGALGLRGDTHSPHPHCPENPDPAPPPRLTSASPGPSSAIIPILPVGAHTCTDSTQGCSPGELVHPGNPGLGVYHHLLWALIMAQVKTIPSMEVGNNLACHSWGRMLSTARTSSRGHLLPGQGTLPRPRALQSQRQKRHSYLCFNKTRKRKKSKGLDQDPAMDASYHGKD